MTGFKIKRIYESPVKTDGYRILVDRLWPRGIKKEAAELDEWNKEIAPTADLRKWFDHKSAHFEAFSAQYREELKTKTPELDRLRNLARKKTVTLLYAAKDKQVNHAVILKDILES